MLRRPPRSTRTDPLFPYTSLFRSCHLSAILGHSDRLDRIFGAARALADARAVRYFPEAARSRGSTPGKLVHAPHRTLFWSIQCVVRAGERALPGGDRQDALRAPALARDFRGNARLAADPLPPASGRLPARRGRSEDGRYGKEY